MIKNEEMVFNKRNTGYMKRVMAEDVENMEISIAHNLPDVVAAMIDPENERLIQEAISSLVIIAHRLSTITSADQIIVLNSDGGIEETGNHEELMKAGGMYTRFREARQRARSWKISKN